MKEKHQIQHFAVDTIFDILGSILYAIGLSSFAQKAYFVPGGISGLALILNHLWNLPIGLMSLLLNIPLVIFSFRVIGKQFLLKTARSMLICSIFLDLIFPQLPAYAGSQMLASLFSGVFLGAGMTIFYMRGSSSGGTDFLTLPIQVKRPHLSIGFVSMSIDLIILLLGWMVFDNVDAILYGLISTFVSSIVIDKLLYRVGAAKMLIIITEFGTEIANRISAVCERGSTAIRGIGTYTRQEKTILICACSNAQAFRIQKIAHETDSHVFMILTDANRILGEGFRKSES